MFEYCVVLQYVDFCHVVSHSIPCQHLCWMLALHGLLGDVKKVYGEGSAEEMPKDGEYVDVSPTFMLHVAPR